MSVVSSILAYPDTRNWTPRNRYNEVRQKVITVLFPLLQLHGVVLYLMDDTNVVLPEITEVVLVQESLSDSKAKIG